jgi:hypothetical protein
MKSSNTSKPDGNGRTAALERVLKIARAVLRRGGAAGFVAPQSKIHEGYSPSSRLAIRPAALTIPDPIYFQNTLLNQSQAGLPTVGQQTPAGFLTRRQLADRWQVCPHTIARRKDLNPVRFNRRLLRYRLADVLALEQ